MPAMQGAVLLGSPSSTQNLTWQQKGWRYYGAPDDTAPAKVARMNEGAIGEVRFVIGWIAQQIARIKWHVDINGERLSDAEALAMILKVANEEATIMVATNLIVAGQLNYIALSPSRLEQILGSDWALTAGPGLPGDDDMIWVPISVVDDKRRELIEAANSNEGLNVPGLWPHPAKITAPDPPIRSVIDVLEEIEQLQDLAYSQNRSRIANLGILTIANELDLVNAEPNGGGAPAGEMIERVINAPINDPRNTSAAPIIFRAPFEFMTGALSNGARAIQWTRPELEYVDSIESRMRFAIQRLAWGFPVAPEILLGMTATNRAVAFQIEETTYRSHIEPIARLVGRLYARALKLILKGEGDTEEAQSRVDVLPDPTDLLARRHSVADAKDLYDRGLVRGQFVRHVAGIDEEEAATAEDLDRIVLLRKGGQPGQGRELDPSEVAGNEPVRASMSADRTLRADEWASAIRGAVDMAQAAVVNRVGAMARTRLSRQNPSPAFEFDADAVNNDRLPSLLGPDRLAELKLDMLGAIAPIRDQLESYLMSCVAMDPECLDEHNLRAAQDLLKQQFQDWCFATVCSWPLTRAPSEFSDSVLELLVRPDEVTQEETNG